MTDIEISRNANLKSINLIAESLGLDENEIEEYGKYKAKISAKVNDKLINRRNGKLILVTAINPTP